MLRVLDFELILFSKTLVRCLAREVSFIALCFQDLKKVFYVLLFTKEANSSLTQVAQSMRNVEVIAS